MNFATHQYVEKASDLSMKRSERNKSSYFIRWFDEINLGDVGLVCGKIASLGEMYQELAPRGIRVPNGYAVTSVAFWFFLLVFGILSQFEVLLCSFVFFFL